MDETTLLLKSALPVVTIRRTVSALICFHTSSSGLRSGEYGSKKNSFNFPPSVSTLAIGSLFQRKDAILAELVSQFRERHTGSRGAPTDPRLENPYFGGVKKVAVRLSSAKKRSKSVQSPALVAA